ncbi:MAG TPA: TIGR03943 family protein [Jatrophihabitans sp.]
MTGGVSSVILLLFGAALVKLGVSDELLLYVRPVARPWVLLAGITLVLLAAWSLLSLLRRDTAEAVDADPRTSPDGSTPSTGQESARDADESGAPGLRHGHVHDRATRTAWLVLAPVVAVLIVAPPALGEFTANRAPAVNAAATGKTASLAAGSSPVELHLLTFLLLSSAKPAALAGRPVTLVGFVQKQQPGGFTLARLVITCCAADASTGAVTVLGGTAVPPIGGWVRVTGTFAGVGSDANQTPKLAATTVTAIAPPTNPYD